MGAYKPFRLPESKPHYARQKDFHTEHLRVELRLDLDRKEVSGACTLTVKPVRPGVRKVSLDACGMDVRGVALDGAAAEFEYDGSVLTIPLMGPLEGAHSVRVEYSTVPKEGIYFTGPEKEFPSKEVQAWTHSEAQFARHWFPCFDSPNDRSSSELVLTVPAGFRVISNGRLLSEKGDGKSTTFHWREDLPHPTYLTSFVAGRFGELVQEAQGAKLRYNFPESKRADALRYFGETPRMIEVFGELTGVKYPYEKYDQTAVEDFIYGGMENFNATTLSMLYFPDAASEEDFQVSYAAPQTNAVNLVAHELAHQWFGDLVTCVEWSHAWLNEAFATYFQALYVERTRGTDEFRWNLGRMAEVYFGEDESEYRRPIVENWYIHPDDVFDSTTYEKGALMLHELRYYMGDQAFFRGVSEYLKSRSFSNADSHDLRKSLEGASGLSLEEFFSQAFFKPGHPEFQVGFSWDEESKVATLEVRQTQKLEDGTPVFKLPCDVVFYVGGRRVKRRVAIDSADQTLSFALDARPSVVEFDPEHWILKKLKFDKTLDLLLHQLRESADASSRADAARDIGKLKSGRAVEGLKEAAAKEQHWHVRACAMGALGEIGTAEALAALKDIGLPKDRKARRGLAAALGHFKEEAARKALIELLEGDESPYVRCEAALSLAKSWPEGAFSRLREAMKVHSPNETLAEACLEAMGKLKDPEVKAVVKESLAYGRPTRARIGALKAIKERGEVLDDELAVLREALKSDKEVRVRLFIANEIARNLGDRRFLDALKESSESDKDPRVARASLEAFYQLSASAESSAALSKLRSEVEELKEENRRLGRSSQT